MASPVAALDRVMGYIRKQKAGLWGDPYRALHQCEGIVNAAIARAMDKETRAKRAARRKEKGS